MWSKYGQNPMGPGGPGQPGGGGNPPGFGGQGPPPGMMPGQPGVGMQQMQYNPMQQQMQMQQMGMGSGGGMQTVPGPMSMVPPGAAMPMNPGPVTVGSVGGNLIQQQQIMPPQQIQSNVLSTQIQQQQPTPQMIATGMGIPIGAMPNTPPLQMAQQQQQQQQSTQQQQLLSAQQQQIAGGGQQNPNPGANNMLAISQPSTHKEINIVQLSRLGQETVQDIASRFQEVFSALKSIQPTPHRDNSTEKKVQEYFRTIRLLFKRVRIIYEKCNDAGMDYTHVESLIPYKDEPDPRIEAATQCEEYRKALQENQELIETVKLKNRQLREIIDRTRIIIWEINTMLSMRRS